ncbi:MAG TPA: hypothetical protein VKR56_06850 [Candidatus Cybelea sp.]|nr:hypothetical protein [Candidatus Cybelea sp.]
MSGFLRRLVARTIGQANVVRPRPVPPFAVTLDLPIDSSYADSSYVDSSSAVPGAVGSEAERFDGKTILRDRAHAQGERSDDNLSPPHAPAASLERREAGDVSARQDLRVESTSTRDDDALGQQVVRAQRATASVSAREDPAREGPAREVTDQSFREANRIAVRDSGAVPGRGADETERRARSDEPHVADASRTRSSRTFDPDDRRGVARSREVFDPSPLAPALAGPRAAAREAEVVGSRRTPDRSRFDPEPEPEATVVNVTIGRIEVRSPADPPPARTFRREAAAAPQPRDTLDAYLRARSGSKR